MMPFRLNQSTSDPPKLTLSQAPPWLEVTFGPLNLLATALSLLT